nr:reverse transcriptase domain-containing protein [Tanacetum cinerariifolium]
MMAIFHDMIERTMEVFMDDFSVFGRSFSTCLTNLENMLKRCEDTKLALNWEKSHFMVKESIVLGHKISKKEIKVDKAKIEACSKLEGISFEQSLTANTFALLDRFPSAMLAIGYLAPLVVFSEEYRFGGTPLFDLGERTYFLGTSSSCSCKISEVESWISSALFSSKLSG